MCHPKFNKNATKDGKIVKYFFIAFDVGRTHEFLIRIRVKIVWDNVAVDGLILGRISGIPRRFFAGVDDITKEREPGIEVIERTP